MLRKASYLLLVVAMLSSTRAAAVGLGEISLNSALNQKFSAEIELIAARGLETREIIVSLASSQDFDRVGVERFFFLTDLDFNVVSRNGNIYIEVTSSQPVTEPYLNFLVEVLWPNGRMLKEYTVLLDPPTYTDRQAPGVAAPRRDDPGGGGAGRVERTPQRPESNISLSPASRSNPPPRTAPDPADRLVDGTYGYTDRNDTLWSIATRVQPAGATINQTMLALQRMNPEAFIGGNINLLKAGYILRLPSEGQTRSLSADAATAQVAEHNRRWQAYRRGEPLTEPAVATVPEDDARLGAQVDATGDTVATRAQPPGAPEGELRIVAPGEDGAAGASAAGGGADTEALMTALAASEEERQRIGQENDELETRLDESASRLEQAQRQLEVRAQEIARLEASLEQARAAAQEAPSSTAEAPADDQQPWWSATWVWVSGVGAIVVLLVLALISARRRQSREDDDLLAFADREEPGLGVTRDDERTAVHSQAARAGDDDDLDLDLDEPTALETQTDEGAGTESATADAIGEADIYVAYGRYPQAISLLLGALEEDPDRHDVRLKLLELYTDTSDTEGFDAHLSELVERCDNEDILLAARDLEGRIREDGAAADADADHGDAPVPDDGAPLLEDADEHSSVDDFELSLDDDASATPDASDGGDRPEDAPTVPRKAVDDLGGDLGLDFDPDATADAAASADAKTEAEDFDLEGLDLNDGEGRAAGADEAEDPFDFVDDEDTATTKLDLARAYIDMGDKDGARDILSEVLEEGSNDQQREANELLEQLS